MRFKFGILCCTLIAAVSTYATIVNIELPIAYPATMVTSPAAGDDANLNDFVAVELKKLPEPDGDFVVFLTKDGNRLSRNTGAVTPAVDIPPFFGSLSFVRGGGWDSDEQWNDARWHLFDLHGGAGAYAVAVNVFGPPLVYTQNGGREITVSIHGQMPDMGIYDASRELIVLKRWRALVPGINPIYKDSDRGMLTRCMLHAFRGPWPAPWDHFDCGTAHAAWLAIQQEIAADEPGFNDLWHDEQLPGESEYQRPEYMDLMLYNVPEMATRMPGFFSEDCRVDEKIMWARYRTCGYLWWKVLQKDPAFIKNFNGELAKMYKGGMPPLDSSYRALALAAVRAYNGGPIEGRNFLAWFSAQPIFDDTPWCDAVCAQTLYRDKAQVFAYRRRNYYTGYEWVEEEIPYPNKTIQWNVFDCEGVVVGTNSVETNDGGYAGWKLPYYPHNGEDQRLKVKAHFALSGSDGYTDWATAYAVSTDSSYDDFEFIGAVADANAGTAHIEYGAQTFDRPIVNGVFKLPALSGHAGGGEYSMTYLPPAKGLSSGGEPHLVAKDGGNAVFSGNLINASAPANDKDDNGIDDDVELAERFKPYVNMHASNPLHPCSVEATLGTGHLVESYNPDLGLPDMWNTIESEYPQHLEDMKTLFNIYAGSWSEYWYVTFGPAVMGIDGPVYWRETWDYYRQTGLFQKPIAYFNIFGDHGWPVIQYWFFYPYNDWGNDHEGDWEHINVKISSPIPEQSAIEEVVYYFHKKRKTLSASDPSLEILKNTHPYVYVGGHYSFSVPKDDRLTGSRGVSGDCSGGSYWRLGYFNNVGALYTDEEIKNPVRPIPLSDFDLSWLGRAYNDNWWWARFPGMWGREALYISNPTGLADYGPLSPWNHECWCVYEHPDYTNYGNALDSTIAVSRGIGAPSDHASALINGPAAAAPFGTRIGAPIDRGCGEYSAGDAEFTAPAGLPAGRTLSAAANPISTGPNPVRGNNAVVTFRLEAAGPARVTVFDITGRKVATPVDGRYDAGEHTVSWCADVPPGIYLYRLEAGPKTSIKRFVIAK